MVAFISARLQDRSCGGPDRRDVLLATVVANHRVLEVVHVQIVVQA